MWMPTFCLWGWGGVGGWVGGWVGMSQCVQEKPLGVMGGWVGGG